jgi:oligoendopeptidase F
MASQKELPSRDSIDPKYKWNINDIYANDEAWEADFNRVRPMAAELGASKGTLKTSAGALLGALKLQDGLSLVMENLFVYARMKRDEDNANSLYQALTDRCGALGSEIEASLAFMTPEILNIPKTTLKRFLAGEKDLKTYKRYLSEITRQKEHILPEREEEILALSSEASGAAHDIFTMLNNADIKFPVIKDERGKDVELTKGRYSTFLEGSDRRVRADAFKALYSSYKALRNTLAASLNGSVKSDIFYAKARRYESCRAKSLYGDNVPGEVYDKLIETTHDNLPKLQRYLALRKKILKVDELHPYDLYVPIVDMPKKKYSYEKAVRVVRKGLKPLGAKYAADLAKGMASGWIDVYETRGKTSGAYAWGTFNTHPFVLLNYQGNVNDVFTLAHEMGHAMHSFYSNHKQPYIDSDTRIFVAEVASTVNESLLMRQLLAESKSAAEKAYLLNHYLEEFRGTMFRQVMFAEFEKLTHETVEGGGALTADTLSEMYRGLNEKFFGKEVAIDTELDMEWSRIPHFYSNFYVYKYATGFAAATAITKAILEEGKPAVKRYLEFLASGNSDFPLELLKKAGVDLTTSAPVQAAYDVFDDTLNKLEELITK